MANARFNRKPSRIVRRRLWIQAAFLLVWLDPLALRLHTVCSPVFHCYACPLATFACPIGVVANFAALHVVPFIAVGTLLVVGAMLGGFVCGWVCPFGLVQDLLDRVPLPKLGLPVWTGYLRYAVLVGLVLVVPFLWGEAHPLFICRVCPAGAMEAGLPQAAQAAGQGGFWAAMSTVKWVVLAAFVVAALVKYRPWCTLLCPLGAIFGLFNRLSAVFLRVDPGACNQCGACAKVCRVGLEPERQLKDPLCIRCMECTRCDAIGVKTVFSRKQ